MILYHSKSKKVNTFFCDLVTLESNAKCDIKNAENKAKSFAFVKKEKGEKSRPLILHFEFCILNSAFCILH